VSQFASQRSAPAPTRRRAPALRSSRASCLRRHCCGVPRRTSRRCVLRCDPDLRRARTRRRRRIEKIDPWFPSTQACSECGCINTDMKNLNRRTPWLSAGGKSDAGYRSCAVVPSNLFEVSPARIIVWKFLEKSHYRHASPVGTFTTKVYTLFFRSDLDYLLVWRLSGRWPLCVAVGSDFKLTETGKQRLRFGELLLRSLASLIARKFVGVCGQPNTAAVFSNYRNGPDQHVDHVDAFTELPAATPLPLSYRHGANYSRPRRSQKEELGCHCQRRLVLPGGLSAGTGNGNFKQSVRLHRETAI
jgi:hypothetical protein